eukprot:TRINITY_DN16203_c0_g1_i1.p1 TRINITY_DN16203_c0_g1~~TRINITY_DN16203_c0_g1_i1.p1  ORF type:complete len:87 (+),score=7.70 TRINITY_DN16203_c0_g1_i1:299-559(+)
MEMLQNTRIPEIVAEQKEFIEGEYDKLIQTFPSLSRRDLSSFMWAHFVVRSRLFGVTINGTSTQAMVPIADLLNQSPDVLNPYPTL